MGQSTQHHGVPRYEEEGETLGVSRGVGGTMPAVLLRCLHRFCGLGGLALGGGSFLRAFQQRGAEGLQDASVVAPFGHGVVAAFGLGGEPPLMRLIWLWRGRPASAPG